MQREQDTNATYHPRKSHAWGAASHLNIIVDANDEELWQCLAAFLQERGILKQVTNELVARLLDDPPQFSGPEAA